MKRIGRWLAINLAIVAAATLLAVYHRRPVDEAVFVVVGLVIAAFAYFIRSRSNRD